MLLTKLIPPNSKALKEAVATFSRFIEEPHANLNERLVLVLAGGRASCKSSIASGLVIKGNAETGGAAICLHPHDVRDTVWQNCKWTINHLGETRKYQQSISALYMHRKGLRSAIFCRVIEKDLEYLQDKTRGIPHKRFVWIDDADELDSEAHLDAVINALDLRENPVIILTCNPPASKDHWINRYCKRQKHVYRPCYLDVPKEWLGDLFFKNAERLRKNNESAYRSAYLGLIND